MTTLDDVMPDAAQLAAIRRDIDTYEAARRATRRAVIWRGPLAIMLIALAIYVAAGLLNSVASPYEQWTSTPHLGLYLFAAVLTVLAYFWTVAPQRRIRKDLRQRLFPSIFRFIDGFGYTQARKPSSFDRFPREMVGSYDRERFDDTLTGNYRGFPFELFEAALEQGSATVVFKGIGLAFEAERPFAGTLIAGRKADIQAGFFKRVFGRPDLQKIDAGNADLDAAYDFRTDNPDAAQALVVGRLAAALRWLGETWPAGRPLIALKGSDAFLLLPMQRDYFQLPDIGTQLDYERHVRPMIVDLVTLLETAALVRKVAGEA